MLETHIMMSSLIFRLIHTLVLHLALLLVLCLIFLMDLTITHIVLVHKRTTLWLNALVTTHVLIVVIISYVVLVFLLEGLTLTLSLEIWMVHVFPIVVHVPLGQMVKCKGQRRPFQAAWLSSGFLRSILCGEAAMTKPLGCSVKLRWLKHGMSYLVFMTKPSTRRMHDPGSNVPHIWPKSAHR
jgi:hypothetical protein